MIRYLCLALVPLPNLRRWVICNDVRILSRGLNERAYTCSNQAAEDARAHALVPAQHQAVAPRSLGQLHEPL